MEMTNLNQINRVSQSAHIHTDFNLWLQIIRINYGTGAVDREIAVKLSANEEARGEQKGAVPRLAESAGKLKLKKKKKKRARDRSWWLVREGGGPRDSTRERGT